MPDWVAGPPEPLIPEMPNRATGPPEPLIIYARVVPRGQARTPTAAHSISGPTQRALIIPAMPDWAAGPPKPLIIRPRSSTRSLGHPRPPTASQAPRNALYYLRPRSSTRSSSDTHGRPQHLRPTQRALLFICYKIQSDFYSFL